MRADYEVWSEMQRDAAPEVVTLRDCRRTARKDHVCNGCGKPGIKAGDAYSYAFALVDGQPEQTRFCDGFRVHYGEGCPVQSLPTPPRAEGA